MMEDVLQELSKMRQSVASAQQIRARAEAGIRSAKQRLDEIDVKLRGLKVDPEKAEDELAAMEARLDQVLKEFAARLAQEKGACQAILEQL